MRSEEQAPEVIITTRPDSPPWASPAGNSNPHISLGARPEGNLAHCDGDADVAVRTLFSDDELSAQFSRNIRSPQDITAGAWARAVKGSCRSRGHHLGNDDKLSQTSIWDWHERHSVGHPRILKVIIVRAPDRGQLRGQITGTKTIRTVGYPSKKNKEARYGEGATEIERIKWEEVKTNIVKAIAQPCRIHALIDGHDKWDVHIPDISNLLANGERVLIDAKRNWSDFRTAKGQRQTFLGELAAEALGYRYERIVLGSMGEKVQRDNIDEIQASRFVHVPDHLVARAASAVARGPISLGNLADLLQPVNGRSMSYALMVRRVIEIDLEARLSPRSECIAVKPLPLAMPSLRR